MRIPTKTVLFGLLVLIPISAAWSLPRPSTTQKFLSNRSLESLRRPFNRHTKLSQSSSATSAGMSGGSTPPPPSPYRWSIMALLASAFLNLLGFTMAGPITPALGQHFGLEVGASFGSLTSAYPLGMLFGLFLWPSLSDKWGRSPVIVLSLFGTGLGLAAQSYVVASNQSLALFLISRVITGSFAGSSPVSKAYLADVSGDSLGRNLAWRDAASTLAFLVGPLLGGVFLSASTSTSFVIGISSVASLIAAVVVGLLVKPQNQKDDETLASQQKGVKKDDKKAGTNFDSGDMCPLGTSLWAGVATVCFISFLFNVGDSTFHAFFALLLKNKEVAPKTIGLVYSCLAAISFTVSATLTSPLMKKFGAVPLCVLGLICTGSGLVSMGLGSGIVAIIAAASIYYCGVPLYSPSIPTMLLRCAPLNRRGFILGLDGAVNTVARIISPLVMGSLYHARGPKAAFGLAGGASLFAAVVALLKRYSVLRNTTQQQPPPPPPLVKAE